MLCPKGKNIILFGPPGIGKSTIIRELSKRGVPTLDLEEVFPDKIRFNMPNKVHNVVLGAADLDPKRYNDQCKILLTLAQEDYEARRAQRDKERPGKAAQQAHKVDDWLKGVHYDLIIINWSLESTVNRIMNMLK